MFQECFIFADMYVSLSISLSTNTNNNNHTGTNTSSPFYDGSWTMYDNMTKHDGLRTATKSSNFGILDTKNGKWSLEIAFPLRNGSNHGGLLDSEELDGFVNLFFKADSFVRRDDPR